MGNEAGESAPKIERSATSEQLSAPVISVGTGMRFAGTARVVRTSLREKSSSEIIIAK